jgi:FkbM family methyltransferase
MPVEFKQQEIDQTYAFCRPYLKSFRTALDIGCDEFMFAGKLEKDFNSVHCWDFRDKTAQMQRHVTDTDKIHFHHTGLGETEATRYTKPGVGRVKGTEPWGNSTVAIPIVPLDSFGLFDSVDFIKMDVEGYEPLIIRGAIRTIESSWPVILCEINRGDFTAKELLEGMGYRCAGIYHKLDVPHDYLFVRD